MHSERLGESCGRSMALLADVLVVIHLLYILFVVGGGGAIIAEQAGAFGEPARDPRERVITVAW